MLKKTITYSDFDGNERTEDLYFNLTQTELIEMSMELPDDISETVPKDATKVDEQTGVKILEKLGSKGVLDFIKSLVLKSYGIKSQDGRRFEKTEEITREFSQTLAYDAIIMELMSDDEAAAKFVNSVIPAKVVDNIAKGNNGKPVLPVK